MIANLGRVDRLDPVSMARLVESLAGLTDRVDAGRDSDVDVLVVVRRETRELRRLLLDAAFEVSMERGCWLVPAICPLDEVDGPAGRYDPFYVSVAKEGVLVAGW